MNKRLKRVLIIVFIVVLVIFILFLLGGNLHNNKKMLSMLNPNDYRDYDNLMIVAHPDDETLWGFNKLEKKKFLVVCVTCGRNKIREKFLQNISLSKK